MSKKNYIPTVVVMYILFFMIAFVTGLQNPLSVIVKVQYDVPMSIAFLGNFANFFAYAFMGLPAGMMLKKYGYKFSSIAAVTVGILGVGTLFISGLYDHLWIYFVGAFVSGLSMCMLNTVVNPLLNFIGGGGNRGNQLLQWGGSLNSFAASIVPFVVGMLMGRSGETIIPGVRPNFHISDVNPVFIVLIAIFAVALLMILFTNIPEYQHDPKKKVINELIVADDHNCFHFRHFKLGAIAIFLYVGIEVSIANVTNIYLIHEVGISPAIAGSIVGFYWFLMFIGRLAGGYLGARFSSKDMLSFSTVVVMALIMMVIFTPENLTLSVGRYSFGKIPVNVVFLVLTGLFTSVMWGTIYNMSVEGLGKYTPTATGFFMMMVCGGGIIPIVQAVLADHIGCRASFWFVILCLTFLLYYASSGYKNVNKKIKVK